MLNRLTNDLLAKTAAASKQTANLSKELDRLSADVAESKRKTKKT